MAQCIFRNSRNLLRVSYVVVVLNSDKRVIYNERVKSIVRWQKNQYNILIVIEAIEEPCFDHFLVSIKHSNDWKISAEDWGYNYCQQVHLPMSSNMYQYPKHFKIRVSQLLKMLAYRYVLSSTFYFCWHLFGRPNAFLFGPNHHFDKETENCCWRCRIYRWPNAFFGTLLRVSNVVVVLNSDKRVIYIIAPSIMKEWSLLLDGRRIIIIFLLLLKQLRNHVLIIF
jgi:hypothetical protein